MNKNCQNIYKAARESAGFTQEEVSQLLNVCCRSVSEYETGKTIPNDDIVCAMIEVYGTRYLAYMHLKRSMEVRKRFLPEIDVGDLAKLVLRWQKKVGDLHRISGQIMKIACDGKFDGEEKAGWIDVEKKINEVAGAALSLIFSSKDRENGFT